MHKAPSQPPTKRLCIFAKGNNDLVDALFGCEDRLGRWDGINQVFRDRGLPVRAKVRHETSIRSDALLMATGHIPEALAHLDMARPHDLSSQFSDRVYGDDGDVIALSLQADFHVRLFRHRQSGALFYPRTLQGNVPELQAWMRAHCESAGLPTASEAMVSLRAVIARIHERRPSVPVLLLNIAEFVPGDQVYHLGALPENLPMRIKQFNLAAMELTRLPNVYMVDVDRIIAGHGAARLKLDAVRVASEGSKLVAEEIVRILSEIGVV